MGVRRPWARRPALSLGGRTAGSGRPAPRQLRHDRLLRAGRQFLLVARDREGWAVVHYRADGSEAGRHPLAEGATVVGRGSVLFVPANEEVVLQLAGKQEMLMFQAFCQL